jgi:N-acetylneuraminic acid mutarotase
VEEYDPAADTWTRRADMPTARQGVCAAAVDGIIYAIGGWNPSGDLSTVEAYDPATDTWTTKADMPTRRNNPAVAVVDGIIYVISGNPGIEVTSAVEAYNPATDKWTTKADMPTARDEADACVIDGRIYVSGGASAWPGTDSPTLSTVEVYDPATDTWTQASDMPRARFAHAASVVNGKMYIFGGVNSEMIKLAEGGKLDDGEMEEFFSIVEVYDPATDTWTTAADRLPTFRASLTAAVVDGRIYAIGGGLDAERTPSSAVEEYAPGLPDNISVTNPAGKLLRTWGEVKSE